MNLSHLFPAILCLSYAPFSIVAPTCKRKIGVCMPYTAISRMGSETKHNMCACSVDVGLRKRVGKEKKDRRSMIRVPVLNPLVCAISFAACIDLCCITWSNTILCTEELCVILP